MDHIGRYKILGELGHGAMGVVYHALDPSIGREVAIKIIRLSDLSNAEQRGQQRERLFREARSAGILSHPGIVTIYDMAEQDELAYIAMEYVSGSTLEQLLAGKESLDPAFISSILRQTAAALDYAHHKGIVHRDIKPANIIVTEAGIAKIADFGIAKISAADQLTQTGLIVGTPNYMAPEQVQGKPVEGFADQYSLAVIAFEMLTGDKPFVAEHLTTLVYQIVCEEPPPAQRLNPTLGSQIEAVLRRALSKQKEARFPTCTAMVEALEAGFAATPNWKSLGRGASLSMPTMAEPVSEPVAPAVPPPAPAIEKAPIHLPPPARSLPEPFLRQEVESKSRAIPILITLILGGGLAVGAYYSKQWLYPEASAPAPQSSEPAKPALRQETPPSQTPPIAQAPPVTPPVTSPAATAPEPAKPVPKQDSGDNEEKPDVQEAPPPKPVAHPPRAPRIVTSVEIPVRTEPAGATAVLDGLLGTACITPCALKASSGEHTISLTHAGYKTTSRAVTVHGDEPVDLPVLTLAQAAGVLMIQSNPAGATINVDDRKWPSVTPAQVTLPPGKYRLTLEKGNLKAVQTIEIRDGDLRHLILSLNAP